MHYMLSLEVQKSCVLISSEKKKGVTCASYYLCIENALLVKVMIARLCTSEIRIINIFGLRL